LVTNVVGVPKEVQPAERTILLLLDMHSAFIERLLRQYGYPVALTNSPQHTVAVCMSNPVSAVVIDQCLLGNAEGWSLPQSIKMVKAGIPVILLCHGPIPENVELPAAVDEIISDSDLQSLLAALKRLLPNYSAAAQAP